MINKAYKFKLIPNKTQQKLLDNNINNCRFLYNQMLEERQKVYQENKDIENIKRMYGDYSKTEYPKYKTEKQYKEEFKWLKNSDSIALQQTRIDLEKAYINFFRNIKRGKKTDLKFKSKKNPKNSYRTLQGIELKVNKIKLPKIGWIKFKKSREVKGAIKNVTVIKNVTIIKNIDKYYISICIEADKELKKPINKKIGIDLGLIHFIVTSDKEFIENPKYLKQSELKLKKAQRKLSKRKRGGKNRYKQILKINRIHEKIKNQRNDFLHKLSSRLINENQVIYIEDLNIKGMLKNHHLAKSIYDASWNQFVRMLEYKANWYGRTVKKIGRFDPSSKLCSRCEYKKEDLTLNDRIFNCPKCGLNIDRDLNASLNILKVGNQLDSLLNISPIGESS